MIIHREAGNEFRAFKIAEVLDKFGLRIVSIQQVPSYFGQVGQVWKVWAQGEEVDTNEIDKAIDAE